MAESVTKEVAKRLALYLKTATPEIKNVLEYFPEPNEKLVYPCISLTVGKPAFRALSPYEKEKTTPSANKSDVQYVVGIYDIIVQLDIWSRNKEERDDLYETVFNALNPNIVPMGLSLQLKDYYNQWCRYDISNYEFIESEEQSQRGEFRVKFDLLTTCKAIRFGKQYVMATIETQQTLYNESEKPEDFET